MALITEIMDRMRDQIRAAVIADGIANVQVEGRMVINPSPPCIDIYPADLSRDAQASSFSDIQGGWVFTVRARVLVADNEAGQDLLLRFMDDEDDLSVPAALLDDPTLNGMATSLHVFDEDTTGFELHPVPGSDGALLGVRWRVEVLKALS